MGFDPLDCLTDCINNHLRLPLLLLLRAVVAGRRSEGRRCGRRRRRGNVLTMRAFIREAEQRGAPEVLRRRRDGKGRRLAAPEALNECELGRGPGHGAAGPVLRPLDAIDAAGMRRITTTDKDSKLS